MINQNQKREHLVLKLEEINMGKFLGDDSDSMFLNHLKIFTVIGGISVTIFFVAVLPCSIGVWRIINFIKEFFV